MTGDLFTPDNTIREIQDRIQALCGVVLPADITALIRESLKAAADKPEQPKVQKAPSPGWNKIVAGGFIPQRGP